MVTRRQVLTGIVAAGGAAGVASKYAPSVEVSNGEPLPEDARQYVDVVDTNVKSFRDPDGYHDIRGWVKVKNTHPERPLHIHVWMVPVKDNGREFNKIGGHHDVDPGDTKRFSHRWEPPENTARNTTDMRVILAVCNTRWVNQDCSGEWQYGG